MSDSNDEVESLRDQLNRYEAKGIILPNNDALEFSIVQEATEIVEDEAIEEEWGRSQFVYSFEALGHLVEGHYIDGVEVDYARRNVRFFANGNGLDPWSEMHYPLTRNGEDWRDFRIAHKDHVMDEVEDDFVGWEPTGFSASPSGDWEDLDEAKAWEKTLYSFFLAAAITAVIILLMRGM